MPFAVTAYSFVLALHIMAVVAAFGLPLGYPLLVTYVRRSNPEALPGVHAVQLRLNRVVTAPGMALILIFGGYMAGDRDLWGEVWVIVPLVLLVVIGGIGGAVVNPALKRLTRLAREGPAPEYEATYRRYMAAEVTLGVLVLVAIFFMAGKP